MSRFSDKQSEMYSQYVLIVIRTGGTMDLYGPFRTERLATEYGLVMDQEEITNWGVKPLITPAPTKGEKHGTASQPGTH